MEPEKISGFAHGLEASGQPFLWALKDHPSWRAGLPGGYMEKVAGRGKIVSWAPQDDILKHKAVGCYITHCGWNSALESVRHGVRMICYPINSDHFVNCAYMVNMLEIGIRLTSSDSSSVKDCIERVIKGNEGRHLQQMVNKMREAITVGEAMCVARRNLSLFMERMKNN
jgi:UDP:flavonoid glycosyltransferase YjiC (YdhE family)